VSKRPACGRFLSKILKIDYSLLNEVSISACKVLETHWDHDPSELYEVRPRGRARHYDPVTGRFTSKDPTLFNGGDTDLYGYSLGDPIDNSDPTGLDTYSCWEWGGGLVPHNYLCVDSNCGGQGPNPDTPLGTSIFGTSPGYNSSGASPGTGGTVCSNKSPGDQAKKQCMDQCVANYLAGSRQPYSLAGHGESCSGFVNRVLNSCQAACN
jgi:RHS repeat-associated protein